MYQLPIAYPDFDGPFGWCEFERIADKIFNRLAFVGGKGEGVHKECESFKSPRWVEILSCRLRA